GMKMLTMTNLSTECLIQLTKLGYDATPFNQILKQNAKREMRLRLGKVTVADVLAAQPVTTNLLKFMRATNALRDYFRDIGRMVLAAEGRKANDSHADCYQYFCVLEYGTDNGRLHFHAVHFMRTLPTGSVEPNFGR